MISRKVKVMHQWCVFIFFFSLFEMFIDILASEGWVSLRMKEICKNFMLFEWLRRIWWNFIFSCRLFLSVVCIGWTSWDMLSDILRRHEILSTFKMHKKLKRSVTFNSVNIATDCNRYKHFNQYRQQIWKCNLISK